MTSSTGSSLRSALGRVRGLGSAKEGVDHWWRQRLTAIALVPLGIWFVVGAIGLVGADFNGAADWVANPFNAVLLLLLIFATFQHAELGLQVVIEDYIHAEPAKMVLLVLTKFVCLALGVACAFSVVRITLG
jgi:succinate dehydrogenase / fumarate reductase membrane anchor subunit